MKKSQITENSTEAQLTKKLDAIRSRAHFPISALFPLFSRTTYLTSILSNTALAERARIYNIYEK